MNPLYKGLFNWHGQRLEEWCRAKNAQQAYVVLCARIAVRVKRASHEVKMYFKQGDRYRIEEVKE